MKNIAILFFFVLFAQFGIAQTPSEGAPTPPVREAGDVISIFSDAYNDIPGTDLNPWWSQSTVVTIEDIGGNPTLKYASFNYQGTQFTTKNVSEFEFLHLDMWTADATAVNVYCISPGAEKGFSLPITQDQWVSYDIPLSYFSDVVDLTSVFQFKFDGGDGSQTLYLDNMYFYRAAGISTYTVTYTVTDGTDPIEGALVNVDNQNYATDASGIALAYLEDGTYSYTVAAAGFQDNTGNVTVSGGPEAVSVTMNPLGNPATEAPNPPARDPGDVMSIFSDAYTDLPGTDFNPFWGQTTVVSTIEINGNPTLKYANFNYQGTALSGSFDMSEMEYLHIDMWTADATDVKVTPISGTGEYLVGLTPIVSESWESYDIPLSEFSDNGVSLNDIFQMKFDGQGGVNPSNIFLDNIYFYREAVTTYTVTFNVSDGTDPISGAIVSISGENLSTDAGGVATIDLEDGTYSYTVTAAGFITESGSVTVNGADETVDVEMTESANPTYTVTFTVTDGTDPVEGANIEIDLYNLTTDASGIATLNLEDGTYSYTVTFDGYFDDNGEVTVNGAPEAVDIIMTSFAVTLPLDFENGPYMFNDFDGGVTTVIPNPQSGGINTSAYVGQQVRNGGQMWGGSWILLDDYLDFTTNNTFTMKVYSPEAGVPVLLKLEGEDSGTFTELTVNTTVAEEWEVLTYDFSGASSDTYIKLVFIFDMGTVGAGEAYLFDDVTFTASSGVAELSDVKFNLYPNPVTDRLLISGDTQLRSAEIYNIQGQLIARELISGNSIDVSSLQKGIYIILLNDAEGNVIKGKFIKM